VSSNTLPKIDKMKVGMKKKSQVAIIGYGYVGRAMARIFPEALIYDPFLKDTHVKTSTKKKINKEAQLAIICVPTPMKEDGSCDTSIVEETVKWLETPLILIKSTVPPETTDRLIGSSLSSIDLDLPMGERCKLKHICFSPEYIGEGNYFVNWNKYPDPKDPRKHDFMIIGGRKPDAVAIQNIFQRKLGPDKFYYLCSAIEAELIKYMENSWGATKVTFCNEFYEICKAFGVSYEKVREGWLLDKRVERMHTAVFPDSRGFGGKCFPKDVNAIVKASEKAGYKPSLLREVLNSNEEFKKNN